MILSNGDVHVAFLHCAQKGFCIHYDYFSSTCVQKLYETVGNMRLHRLKSLLIQLGH